MGVVDEPGRLETLLKQEPGCGGCPLPILGGVSCRNEPLARKGFGEFFFGQGRQGAGAQGPRNLRLADLRAGLPAPSAGDQPAEMVVFHFPGGGSIAANVNRWKKQFAKPEGMTEADFARQSSTSVDTLPITILQVQGRYIGSRMPGRPAPKPLDDARMIATIIETSKGPYFIKITGPRKTVDHHQKAIDAMIQGLKRGPGEPKGKKKSPTSRPRG